MMKLPVGKKNPSKLLASIHETASGFYKTGTMNEKTMREFDVFCLIQGTARSKRIPLQSRDLKADSQMLRLAHSLFLLRFFGSARRAPSLSEWREREWQPALGESSGEAMCRFREQSYLVPATLSAETAQMDIQCVWGAPDLKQMAIVRGLKRSGRKEELAKALLMAVTRA